MTLARLIEFKQIDVKGTLSPRQAHHHRAYGVENSCLACLLKTYWEEKGKRKERLCNRRREAWMC